MDNLALFIENYDCILALIWGILIGLSGSCTFLFIRQRWIRHQFTGKGLLPKPKRKRSS